MNKIGIFGSFATGKTKKKSDVDLLVEFEDMIDLFDFVHLNDEIRQILKNKVDLVTLDTIKRATDYRLGYESIRSSLL